MNLENRLRRLVRVVKLTEKRVAHAASVHATEKQRLAAAVIRRDAAALELAGQRRLFD